MGPFIQSSPNSWRRPRQHLPWHPSFESPVILARLPLHSHHAVPIGIVCYSEDCLPRTHLRLDPFFFFLSKSFFFYGREAPNRAAFSTNPSGCASSAPGYNRGIVHEKGVVAHSIEDRIILKNRGKRKCQRFEGHICLWHQSIWKAEAKH